MNPAKHRLSQKLYLTNDSNKNICCRRAQFKFLQLFHRTSYTFKNNLYLMLYTYLIYVSKVVIADVIVENSPLSQIASDNYVQPKERNRTIGDLLSASCCSSSQSAQESVHLRKRNPDFKPPLFCDPIQTRKRQWK